MLKANVGLSRKLSENYQSTGFSLNLEGEINASLDDPEAVIERVRELYDLADEALQRQIEAHQSDSAIASRDADPKLSNNGHSNGHPAPEANGQPSRNGHRDEKPQNGEPATNKQVQFLSTLAKTAEIVRAEARSFHRGDHRPAMHPLRPDQEGGRGRHRGPESGRGRGQSSSLNLENDFNFPSTGDGGRPHPRSSLEGP